MLDLLVAVTTNTLLMISNHTPKLAKMGERKELEEEEEKEEEEEEEDGQRIEAVMVNEVLTTLKGVSSFFHCQIPQLLEKVNSSMLVTLSHPLFPLVPSSSSQFTLQAARVLKMVAVSSSQWSEEAHQQYLRWEMKQSYCYSVFTIILSYRCVEENVDVTAVLKACAITSHFIRKYTDTFMTNQGALGLQPPF